MTQRLIRVFLAFAVAFVFIGRMEAAAEHCMRLAEAAEMAEPIPAPDAAPCHGAHDAAPAKTTHHPAHDNTLAEQCECIAALTGFTAVLETPASTHIEPYAWARPETATFVSVEPAPALRPPRA